MPKCSFCGTQEKKSTPLCHNCGALRYPVANENSYSGFSRKEKIKLSAAVAAAIVTPGSLIVLALVGASKFKAKK